MWNKTVDHACIDDLFAAQLRAAKAEGELAAIKDGLRGLADESGIDGWGDEREIIDRLRPRLMPEGMEWPRYEDGEPVRLGDRVSVTVHDDHGDRESEFNVDCMTFYGNGARIGGGNRSVKLLQGERVKRPAPKAFDADGVEIRVGDTVWDKRGGYRLTVCGIYGDGSAVVCRYDDIGSSEILTHGTWRTCNITSIRPAIGADGEPVKRGDTVWCIATDEQLSEMGINPEGRRDLGDALTVDLVWAYGGERWASFKQADGDVKVRYLTHERPDSWERLEEDARSIASDIVWNLGNWSPSDFENVGDDVQARVLDLVHRAMALAGVSE